MRTLLFSVSCLWLLCVFGETLAILHNSKDPFTAHQSSRINHQGLFSGVWTQSFHSIFRNVLEFLSSRDKEIKIIAIININPHCHSPAVSWAIFSAAGEWDPLLEVSWNTLNGFEYICLCTDLFQSCSFQNHAICRHWDLGTGIFYGGSVDQSNPAVAVSPSEVWDPWSSCQMKSLFVCPRISCRKFL